MELHVAAELEANLVYSAAPQGRKPEELAQEVLISYFEEERRFGEAVKRGEERY
jgi:hypothetical protein